MKKILLYSVLFNLCFNFSQIVTYGQDPLNTIIPPSPEVSAFKKFGDYPVSYYTGLPDISIPIYSIDIDEVQIPLKLSYHAAGIKVNESASHVGLGWSLMAGGVLSRTIKGIPDENQNGYLDDQKGYKVYPSTLKDPLFIEDLYFGPSTEFSYLMNVNEGSKDSESDEYSIDILDLHTNFVFDQNGNPQCYPNSDIKIIYDKYENSWEVKDTKGTLYYFKEPETISQIADKGITATDQEFKVEHYTPREMDLKLGEISGWYITKIVTSNGHKIDFQYGGINNTTSFVTDESLAYLNRNPTFSYGLSSLTFHSYKQTRIQHKVPQLRKIIFPNGEIDFNNSTEARQDEQGLSYPLGEIEIKDSNLQFYKKFILRYSYFLSDNPNGSTNLFYYKRLKLTQIQEYDSFQNSIPPFTFSYNEDIKMPTIRSHAQDHWGFFNGSTGNDNLIYKFIPSLSYLEQDNDVWFSDPNDRYAGADRTPKFPEMQAWTLHRINYPTGGFTTFEYEPHNYYVPSGSTELETFGQSEHVYSNISVTSTNEILRNTICIHNFIVPGIQDRQATANITMYFAHNTGGRYSHKVYIRETGKTTNVFYYAHNGDTAVINENIIGLISGRSYQLVMESNLGMPDQVKLNLNYKYSLPNSTEGTNIIAGGLRIKKITSNTGESIINYTKEYKYNKENSAFSSAYLNHKLMYFLKFNSDVNPSSARSSTYSFQRGANEILQPAAQLFFSRSLNGLGTTKGASVGYSRVEEIEGYEKNGVNYADHGKSIMTFTVANNNSSSYVHPDFMSGYYSCAKWDEPSEFILPKEIWSTLKAMQAWNSTYPFFPFIEEPKKGWEEGLLVRKEVLNATNQSVSTLSNYYSFGINPKIISEGLKTGELPYSLAQSPIDNRWGHINKNVFYQRYFIESDNVRLDSIIEKNTYEGKNVIQSTYLTYEVGRQKIISKMIKSSDGHSLTTNYQYPFNFGDAIYNNMTLNNYLPIVKTITNNNGKIVSGSKKAYGFGQFSKNLNRNIYLIDSISAFRSDGWEKDFIYSNYDSLGNLMQFHKKDDLATSYLWSYNQTYPVASLTNGKFSLDPTLSEAAYIGFESYEKTNNNPDNDFWNIDREGQSFTTDAKVGKYAWYMTTDYGPTRKVKPASPKSVYTFSGWAKTPASFSGECYFVLCADGTGDAGWTAVSIGNTGGKWKYFEVTLNLGNIGSSISTICAYPWKRSGSEVTVDELRLQPTDAQMTTYTYSPLLGMTSKTDPNGITTYYEYDSFGRLKNVKDHEWNILKQTLYHYQNQP